jgi:hypothetical protein
MNDENRELLKKILFHMESDPKMGHIGIAEKLELIEERVRVIEGRHKVIYRVGVVVGALCTSAIGFIVKIKIFS